MSQQAVDVVHRSCNLCEAHCGVSVHVDREAQSVLTVKGDPDDALSRGYICPKAYGLKGLQEDPDRLRVPQIRENGSFRDASWEEALELVGRRLSEVRAEHGDNAVATYLGNPNAHDYAASIYLPAFQRALGTRWRFSATSVDQLPKMVSSCLMFGGALTIPVPDLDRTDFLLVLGANPLASNGSLMTAPDMPGRLRKLRERGGKLVVVDPRRSETAAIADQHLFLRPGTDAYLLFALVHGLFAEGLVRPGRLAEFTEGIDEVEALAQTFSPESVAEVTGVPAGEIRELARQLAGAERAAVYGRIGTCTQAFGTLASWLVDVLNVLTGNLDREGGVLFPRPAHGPASDRPRRKGRFPFARWRSHVRELPEAFGELPVAALAEEIDSAGDERVRALVTVSGNPVLSTPNGARLEKALDSLEFMVSVDIYQNETTRLADVILPTTPPLERENYDMAFHGFSVHNHAKWSPPALPKAEGSRHVWEILLEIAARVTGTTPEAIDELILGSLLGATVGGEKTACPEITEEQARARLGSEMGPARLLDLMLRTGPYGDRFDDSSEGLSRAKLEDSVHGVDLGPLAARLPTLLATESSRIELAPPPIVEDVARLTAELAAAPADRLVLVGRRHLRSNNSWFHNLPALAKGKDRCTLQVHPDDARRLGLAEGGIARVRSRVGQVEAPVEVTDGVMRGVVSLPHGHGHTAAGARLRVAAEKPGVNSNLLTDETGLDALSGNAVLNGIPVAVEAT
ncbi:MAG: molybdopterin oxidoreductase family protein [Myxococcales bacterium]|nr:molybdopterin oxidoreductase family protein [Myxococcales bacterium]